MKEGQVEGDESGGAVDWEEGWSIWLMQMRINNEGEVTP